TQTTSPWVTIGASNDARIGQVAQAGVWNVGVTGTLTSVSSTTAFQGGTWNVGITGQPTVTASLIGVPTFVGSVVATQGGTWNVTQSGSWFHGVSAADSGAVGNQVPLSTRSYGAGALLRTELVTGSLAVTQAGVWGVQVSGALASVGSVTAFQGGSPWGMKLQNAAGNQTADVAQVAEGG